MSEERTYQFEIRDANSPLIFKANVEAVSGKQAVIRLRAALNAGGATEDEPVQIGCMISANGADASYFLDPDKIDESHIVGRIEPRAESAAGDVSERNREDCEDAPRVILVGFYPGQTDKIAELMVNHPVDWVHIFPGSAA